MTPSSLLDVLKERVLLLDGGLGSLLIEMGLERGRGPEWWNLEHPERVTLAHRGYVEAGSDVIHANTFGANPLKLQSGGLAGRCREINTTAVELAHRACGPKTWVAGDVGPTGLLFPPMGNATEDQLRAAFTEQLEVLVGAGVDLLSIETMYDLREAKVAVATAHATGLPVFAFMTFEVKPRGFFTIVGNRIGPSLCALNEAGADVVGANCSVGSRAMIAMIAEARLSVAAPLAAQPNAGVPRVTPEGVVYDAAPESFAQDLLDTVAAGARAVGGCCGTNPDFIRAARALLDTTRRP